jgi:putative transposase
MSGRPKIDIVESRETLKQLMKAQTTILGYNKLQSLYLLKLNKIKTVREIALILGKGEATIHRWFRLYRVGGIDLLLKERKSPGRPKKVIC